MCKHVFKISNMGGPEFYCNIHMDRSSPCGSWINKELFFGSEDEQCKQMERWDKWAQENHVEESGICECFINGKP
jgi:hypothetical protein